MRASGMYSSIPVMHRTIAERLGPRIALRSKKNGFYYDFSWRDFRRQADNAAAGLIGLGVQKGDRVALLSANRIEWMIADQAILSTGAADVPLHAPLAPKQVEYQVGHSESRGIIVSNQEQADKVFKVLAQLPKLEFLVSFDPIQVPQGCRLKTLTWAGLQQRGFAAGPEAQQEIRRREQALTHDDLVTIIYTSGTTGNPKGVMLTHGNLVSNAMATRAISDIGPNDVLLSWLPYSHIYARTVDLYVPLLAEMVVALGESVDTLVQNLAETWPTWLTSVPRFYEKVWSNVEQLPPADRAAALRRIFGPRIRTLSSGGAPLPVHVCNGFMAAGIPMYEGYGLTETSPVLSFNNPQAHRVGSVGKMLPDAEVKIAEDGEILVRGPQIMKGYWRNPEATAEAIVDGWFHTGDVGRLDEEGFLYITDRKKDLIITSAGKNIAPAELERILLTDPYIDQAVAYGDGRRFVSALVVPNFPSLEQKAKELGCAVESDGGFITSEPIRKFYEGRIKELMEEVSNPERVKKFLLLDRPFKLEDDELTATLKVRRRHVIQKYEQQLAALYDEE